MTALTLFRNQEYGVIALSDGMAYDDDGVVRQIHTKQVVEPAWNTVIMTSGTGAILPSLWFQLVQAGVESFDDVKSNVVDVARAHYDESLRQGYDAGGIAEFILALGGWSDAAQAYESYGMSSSSNDRLMQTEEPWTLKPMATFSKPNASAELLVEVGIQDIEEPFGEMTPVEFGIRMMFAQRKMKVGLAPGRDRSGCTVGGFIQLTHLAHDKATTQIVHRWPDKVGELPTPESDPPVDLAAMFPPAEES